MPSRPSAPSDASRLIDARNREESVAMDLGVRRRAGSAAGISALAAVFLANLLVLSLGCSRNQIEFQDAGNGTLFIDHKTGGPHLGMCTLYWDYQRYELIFLDKSHHYTHANMEVRIDGKALESYEGEVTVDDQEGRAVIALSRQSPNGQLEPLPINGTYRIKP